LLHVPSCGSLVQLVKGQRSLSGDSWMLFDVMPTLCSLRGASYLGSLVLSWPESSRTDLVQFAEVER